MIYTVTTKQEYDSANLELATQNIDEAKERVEQIAMDYRGRDCQITFIGWMDEGGRHADYIYYCNGYSFDRYEMESFDIETFLEGLGDKIRKIVKRETLNKRMAKLEEEMTLVRNELANL